MNWNHFPQLEPVMLQTLPTSSNNKLNQTHQILNWTNWKQPQKQPAKQKPFNKAKTTKFIVNDQKQDKFEQLLKKIQKVKQDYQEDHHTQSKLNFSLKDQNLSFKNSTKLTSQQKSKPLKRARTMKDIENQFDNNKVLNNFINQKIPLNLIKNVKPNNLFQFSPKQTENNNKTWRKNEQTTIVNLNKTVTSIPIKKINKQNFQQNQNISHSPSQNLLNTTSFQTNKKINFDLNILDKVPVRQSINIDTSNFMNLQGNQYFDSFLNQRQELQFSDFQLGSCIGSGKFGQVYKCRHKKTNFICALKKIMKSTIQEYKMIDQFIRELKISYMVDHPNVIRTYGHFHDQFHVFLLMQYAGDGCVIDNLQFKKSQSFSSNVIFQTLNAVDHLHRHKVVHRDIKPENIVVFFTDTYKLCDFGLSAFVNNDMKHTFCGTPDYLSPQMKDVGQYDFSVDLWSLGVLAYELIMGEAPFKDKISQWKKSGWKKSNYWTWKVEYPKQISDLGKSFMQTLLKQKPQQRASIWNSLKDEFITKHNKKQIDIIKSAQSTIF